VISLPNGEFMSEVLKALRGLDHWLVAHLNI
jgi:hypothetical protein